MGRERGLYCRVLIATLLVMTGCGQISVHQEEAMCRITVGEDSFASKSADPDEEMISDVSIMIFDENGDAEECIWLKNGQTQVDVPLVLGKRYSFRACANFGYRTYADHIDELEEMVYYMAYPDEYSKGMPMYAVADDIKVGKDATVNLKLIRLMSKISLRMDRRRLSKGVQIHVTGVRIGNCPKSVKVFSPSRVNDNSQCFSMGFSRDDAQSAILNTISSDNLSGILTLYMLENMQGEMDTPIHEDAEKVFDENDHRREVCSYVEIDMEYLSYEQYSETPRGFGVLLV